MPSKNTPENDLDLLPLKWPRERIRKYLGYLLIFIALLAAAAVFALLALELAPAFLGLAVIIGGAALVATAVVFLGDWWYERSHFFRIKASREIDETQKTATITLNASANRFTLLGLLGDKQKDKYEFSWENLLQKIDATNKSGARKSSFETNYENSLIAKALASIKSWGGFDESQKEEAQDDTLPHTPAGPLDQGQLKLTGPLLKIETVNVYVEVEPTLTIADAIQKHIKGIRTLLADFLNQDIPLNEIHYEVRQGGNRLFGLTFQRNDTFTGYDVVLNPEELSKPGVAQAIHRLFKKSMLLEHVQGIRGLTAAQNVTTLMSVSIEDQFALNKLRFNFAHKHPSQDYLHTPTFAPSPKSSDFFTYIWQGVKSLFNPAGFFANRQERSNPALGDDGTVTSSNPLACDVLTGEGPLKAELARLFKSYTQEINESLDCEAGIDVILDVVEKMNKIRKQRLLKDTPRTQEVISNNTFDADKINIAYSVLVHAILSQGIYGESLLKVQMPSPGVELTQNESQREWAGTRAKIQKEATAKAKERKEKAIQEKEAALKRRLEAEQKLQEFLAQQQTAQAATGANTNNNNGSNSTSSSNPPVSMESSLLPGLGLKLAASGSGDGLPTTSATSGVVVDENEKKQSGSVYSVTM
jgi:hypothetical protein